MLNFLEITRSRLRKRLLSYFFSNIDANLYLREIASILNEDPGNLLKELKKMEREGIFISTLRGNQRYFSLNRRYPLYKELKSVIFKTIGVAGGLMRIVNETKGVEFAFIYGSFAQNKENSSSDIDLFIVGNPDRDKFMEKIDILEHSIKREINYNIYSKIEFKNKIKKTETFVLNLLKRPKIILKGHLNGI